MTTFSTEEQWYIDHLVETILEEGMVHENLTKLMFRIIDFFCAKVPKRKRRGPKKIYPDSMILKLDMLMHLTGKRGETEILREVKRHYSHYFDKLPDQSRLWYRIRDAMPLIERFRWALRDWLGVSHEELFIVDSHPVPVATSSSRWGTGNGFDLATGGKCASKKLSFYGFKLGMVITKHGIPDVYELFPAAPNDSVIVEELLDHLQDQFLLGDKGFINDERRQERLNNQGVWIVTYRRGNMHEQNSLWEQQVLKYHRSLIETVFSQLDGHMHIQSCGAKTDIGLFKRVIGIVTAYTLGIFLNYKLKRPLLKVKELFA